jgi:hypothetical protein
MNPESTILELIAALQPDTPMTGWHFTAVPGDYGWIGHGPTKAADTARYSRDSVIWGGCRLRSPHGHIITCPDFASLYEATRPVPATPKEPTPMTTPAPTTFTLTPSTPPAPDHATWTTQQFYNRYEVGTPIFERGGTRYLLTSNRDTDGYGLQSNSGRSVDLPASVRPSSLGFTYVGNLVL